MNCLFELYRLKQESEFFLSHETYVFAIAVCLPYLLPFPVELLL